MKFLLFRSGTDYRVFVVPFWVRLLQRLLSVFVSDYGVSALYGPLYGFGSDYM